APKQAAQPAPCMLRQTRIGRYEVVSALGQGAMGAVYKAVDPLIERAVAIKTINLHLSKAERAEFEARFYREAKSAGRLNHANIVTIYDVGETADTAYITMEYVEGESLREMLDSGVVLPIELIARIAARVANALNYAHENHVVHRDIKPANIMVTPDRDVKIMDFGIAQIPTGSRTQLGTVLGSPKYMAPEQVTGQPTDGRTDIFALGVVLYEMLTGATPFNGDNLSAIMYQVLNAEPAPPSTLNPRVPPAFDRIVSRALAKRPEDRYPTARAFAQDLGEHDALPLETRAAAARQPAGANRAGSPPARPLDATLILPPRKAQPGAASPPRGHAARIREKMAALLGKARQGRRPLWLAIPALMLPALVLYSQSSQPDSEKPPATSAEAAPTAKDSHATSRRPPASTKHAKHATHPKPAKATLMLAVAPWGEVYVDGKRVGVSPPLDTLQLKPGRHKLEIRNQAFAPYRKTVNLKSGQPLKIRHKFE
ncbi:MAG TPA: protein kinase, partial [Steroidobacteraceae bacterium]|nr:protein kinase [Steroidobacteraceae bacterium]